MGQTFKVPGTTTVLHSFSFWLADPQGDGDGLRLRAYVMGWSKSNLGAVGPILFESEEVAGRTSLKLEKLTFEIAGGLPLEAEGDYVALLSSLDFPPGQSRNGLGYTPNVNSIASGIKVSFISSRGQSGPFSEVLGGADFPPNCPLGPPCWLVGGSPTYLRDLAFEAKFSAP